VLALAQTQRYEFKHSFRAPFYLGTFLPSSSPYSIPPILWVC
jgi:hypothetical protein